MTWPESVVSYYNFEHNTPRWIFDRFGIVNHFGFNLYDPRILE